jgi:hypothetical protein
VNRREAIILWSAAFSILSLCAAPLCAADTNLEQEVLELRSQNAALKEQVQQQGSQLDSLAAKVGALEKGNGPQAGENSAMSKSSGFNLGNVNLSGEGGVVFQKTGSEGSAPNSEGGLFFQRSGSGDAGEQQHVGPTRRVLHRFSERVAIVGARRPA